MHPDWQAKLILETSLNSSKNRWTTWHKQRQTHFYIIELEIYLPCWIVEHAIVLCNHSLKLKPFVSLGTTASPFSSFLKKEQFQKLSDPWV